MCLFLPPVSRLTAAPERLVHECGLTFENCDQQVQLAEKAGQPAEAELSAALDCKVEVLKSALLGHH